jgi:hypothetical protein
MMYSGKATRSGRAGHRRFHVKHFLLAAARPLWNHQQPCDYRKLAHEDHALRSADVTRGPAYFFPYFLEMKSAPAIEKMKGKPLGLLTVLPGDFFVRTRCYLSSQCH